MTIGTQLDSVFEQMASASYLDMMQEELVAKRSLLRQTSLKIWANPELAFEEYKAHDLLCAVLEDVGFDVTRHYLLETGFKAEWTNGSVKPRIAFVCEYDALPDIGHACGHNLIAEAGLAMAFMVKRALSESKSIQGTIVVLGTPAEEGGGGKIEMLDAFKDIDAGFIIHPLGSGVSILNAVTICSSRFRGVFRSKCNWQDVVSSCHVSKDLNSKTIAQQSSLDAAVIAYGQLSTLRKCLPASWRLCVILKPISSSNESQLLISYRSEKGKDMELLRNKIIDCFKAAALSTACDLEFSYTKEYLDQWPNHTITSRVGKYCNIFNADMESIRNGNKSETLVNGSSDVGNVSQILPLVQVFPAIDEVANVHEKEFTAVAGTLAAEKPMLEVAVACARVAIDLLADSDILNDAWKELRDRQLAERVN